MQKSTNENIKQSERGSMGKLKTLAGQTAVYGLSTIIGRLLNFLLVPIYTRVFIPAEYGVITELYSYAPFLLVLFSYGMETAYFRFATNEGDAAKVYRTANSSLFLTTLLIVSFLILLIDPISTGLEYEQNQGLRLEERSRTFVILKMISISVNIFFNLFFLVLCPYLDSTNSSLMGLINLVYDPGLGVEYVLISGLISSSITYLLLQLTVRDFKLGFNSSLWKNMLIYALPLLFAGFAGTVNEFLDRSILKHFLPLSEVGIYGACYKLSMFMTLFVQAYRFGAEPFFFKQASEENAKRTYATLMKFFVIVCCFIFLVVTLYLDLFKYFIGEDYHDGLIVVPILLLANLFLGIYYNLSVWYKVTNNTNWGAGIAILGAVITIGLNLLLIPLIGYVGSAIATAVVYIVMVVIAYLAGNKYYPVNYPLGRIFFYLLLSIGLYMTQLYLIEITGLSFWITGSALLLTFCSAAYLLERGQKILD